MNSADRDAHPSWTFTFIDWESSPEPKVDTSSSVSKTDVEPVENGPVDNPGIPAAESAATLTSGLSPCPQRRADVENKLYWTVVDLLPALSVGLTPPAKLVLLAILPPAVVYDLCCCPPFAVSQSHSVGKPLTPPADPAAFRAARRAQTCPPESRPVFLRCRARA